MIDETPTGRFSRAVLEAKHAAEQIERFADDLAASMALDSAMVHEAAALFGVSPTPRNATQRT